MTSAGVLAVRKRSMNHRALRLRTIQLDEDTTVTVAILSDEEALELPSLPESDPEPDGLDMFHPDYQVYEN
jgi:hypothetical protein